MSLLKNNIFSYFRENDNTELLSLSKDDLSLFFVLLDDCKLSYRKTIGVPDKITFGFEIEIDDVDLDRVSEIEDSFPNEEWIIKNDLTLFKGKEINTPPLIDNERNWIDLYDFCNAIGDVGSITNRCGGHIHIGCQILDKDVQSWRNLFLLWATYENIIFRFGYGEYLNSRSGILSYAEPVSSILEEKYFDSILYNFDVNTLLMTIKFEGDLALNFQNVEFNNYYKYLERNTLEVRSPNGVKEPVILQNNANFFIKLFQYCNSKDFDTDTIMNRLQKNKDLGLNYSLYHNVFLEQSIELTDMIFDNNLDKAYFLRQYIKSFDTSNNELGLEKAKVFIK